MSKHTPGPWATMAIHPGAVANLQVEDGKELCDKVIAICLFNDHINPYVQIKDTQEAYANARLIAAAPDQNAALKKAFAVMIDIQSYPAAMAQLGPICRDYLDGAIESARLALAKAEADDAEPPNAGKDIDSGAVDYREHLEKARKMK